jgi:hypothetical protein
MKVVRDSLATHSQACVTAVSDANKQIGILLNHRIGQQRIDKIFK